MGAQMLQLGKLQSRKGGQWQQLLLLPVASILALVAIYLHQQLARRESMLTPSIVMCGWHM
jgi:hypothetical protein